MSSSTKKREHSRSPDSSPDKDRKRKYNHSEDRNRDVRDQDRHHHHHQQRYRNDHRDSRDGHYRSRYDRNDRRDHRNRRDNRNRRSRSQSFDHKNAKWGKSDDNDTTNDKRTHRGDDKNVEKQKPNFGLSGKLTEETNTYRGVVIKYSEPPEARKPKRRWRLYPFKGDKALQTLYIHRESAYLIGRDRKIVDLPVDHPSCSKQHAALQYRLVPFQRDDGTMGKRVRPYLIDLESANGTYINNKRIEPKKYVELLEKDVIKFGYSSREYVLLHENSKEDALDDDVKIEEDDTASTVLIKKEENE